MKKLSEQKWHAEKCYSGGLIVTFGDPKDFNNQRLQVIDCQNARAIEKVPEMIK